MGGPDGSVQLANRIYYQVYYRMETKQQIKATRGYLEGKVVITRNTM